MADNDQPSSDLDIDPAKPEGPAVTAEGKPVVPAQRDPPGGAVSATDPSIADTEGSLVKMISDYIKMDQAREQQRDQEAAPYRQALMKEMAQPLPQPPSMTEAMPYGAPPVDPQTQRGGILAGILYGVIGLGLAKIFAGRNKSAYFGAIDGLGEALRQRNAGNQTAANQSFERWVKLNEIWHQQQRDRSEDYKLALENRKLSQDQKLSMLDVIANSHGNTQAEVAARKGDMELFERMVDHHEKMVEAQQKQAWKVKEFWLKQQGNDKQWREYVHIMHQDYGVDVDADPEAAERTYPFSEYLRDTKQQQKTKPGEQVPALGQRGKADSNPLGLTLPEKPAAPPQGTTGEY